MINFNWWIIGILTGLLMALFMEIKKDWWVYLVFIGCIILLMVMDVLEDRKVYKRYDT